MEQNIRGLNIE